MTAARQNVCPVCGGAQVAPARTVNPYNGLAGCASCGHVFDPSASSATDRHQRTQLEYFNESFAAREGLFVSFYDRINTGRTVRALGLARGLQVLEIGPGSGMIMAWLATSGHDVRGLDVSPAVARQIGQRWGLSVSVEPLEDYAKGARNAYDMVIMRHVLEHFADPSGALRDVHAMLKPNGRLYIAVPNMGSWHSMFRGWPGYEPYHLQYFNEPSLRHALIRAGFRLVCVASHESLTGWVNTLAGSISGKRKHGAVDTRGENGWKRHVLEMGRLALGALISPVRWLQSSLGRGEELAALAEKVGS